MRIRYEKIKKIHIMVKEKHNTNILELNKTVC